MTDADPTGFRPTAHPLYSGDVDVPPAPNPDGAVLAGLLDRALRRIAEEQRPALTQRVERLLAEHQAPPPATGCAAALASPDAPVKRTVTDCVMRSSIDTARPRARTIR